MSASRLITPAKARLRAEHLSATLPALLLAAEKIAAVVAAGVHGRRRAGPGEQFWQYRRYENGDATTRIDWRASARSPHLLVREREWESAQTALLWLDRSASFHWSSTHKLPSKEERARLLLLALADLLLRGGERVALLGSNSPAMSGRGLLGRVALQLHQLPESGQPLPPLQAYPRQARLVLFGDFLDPVPELATRFKALMAAGLRAHLVQVRDPAEEELPYSGRVLFKGMEKEGDYLARKADKLRSEYLARLSAHQQELNTLVGRLGWTMTRHRTDHKPELALLDIHQQLGER